MLAYAARLGPDPRLQDVSDAELDRQVSEGAAMIAAATCRWLEMLGELVIRGVWADQGAKTPAVWLSWKVSMSPSAARDHVRVALRLRELPKIKARFEAGTLSYSKVRAITRVAEPASEDRFLATADAATAAVLERIIRDTERARDGSRDSERSMRARTGVQRRPLPDGTVEVVVRMMSSDEQAFNTRLERLVERDEQADREDGVVDGPTRGQRQVRAVLEALDDAVTSAPADTSGADRHLVVVHAPVEAVEAALVDRPADAAESAAGGDSAASPVREDRRMVVVRDGRGRPRVMRVSTLRRLACTSNVDLAVDRNGTPHDQGRAKREPSAGLRRLLLERDRSCRFPRCGSTRRLHAHHINHWEHGGASDLDNLVLLCSFHHTFVHERGWRVEATPNGRLQLRPPASDNRTIGDRLVGASEDAIRVAVDDWGLDLDGRSLTPPNWDGNGYDHDLTITVMFNEIVRANGLRQTVSAADSAESPG